MGKIKKMKIERAKEREKDTTEEGKGPSPDQVPAITDRIELSPARWLVPVLVALFTAGVFLPVLQNGFVNWDDTINFLSNPHYRGLGLDELR